jgi:hypothetical protein
MPDLTQFDGMSVGDLRAEWTRWLDAEPPQLRTRELLGLALAYRLQERAHGGLSGTAKRKIAEYQRRFEKDRSFTPVSGPALKPGSSLIKAHRGVRHEVMILERGFGYCGRTFATLSEVAQHITGTKWNGYVFFGLKARSR